MDLPFPPPASCPLPSAKPTQESVNKEWNEMAGEWDDLAGGYADWFVARLFETTGISEREPLTVLDLGCGTGLCTERLRRRLPAESKFLCVDPAKSMIRVLAEKIRAGEWENVQAHAVALSDWDSLDGGEKEKLTEFMGQVDIVVASSVLHFVPKPDIMATMRVLCNFLKPGGMLFHTDWALGENEPDGFDGEKAESLYQVGGLKPKSIQENASCDPMPGSVFIGLAEKEG